MSVTSKGTKYMTQSSEVHPETTRLFFYFLCIFNTFFAWVSHAQYRSFLDDRSILLGLPLLSFLRQTNKELFYVILGGFVRPVDSIEFHWTMRLVLKSNQN